MAGRDAFSARLNKVIAALRKVIRGPGEKDEVADIFSKTKRLYEYARSGPVRLCAVEVPELFVKIEKLIDQEELEK